MSLYSRFAAHYERIFPFRPGVYGFLDARLAPPGGRVLDVGCGPGHYCGRFAAAGAQAVGIDLDEAMIDVATAKYAGAEFAARSMTDLDGIDGPFDLAFCIGNVAAHVDEAGFRTVLAEIAARLRPGGMWVLQTVNWDRFLRADSYAFPPREIGDDGLVFLREYRELTGRSVRFHTELRAANETLFREETPLFPMRAARSIELHRAAGFALQDHFADFSHTPFDPTSGSGSVLVFRRSDP